MEEDYVEKIESLLDEVEELNNEIKVLTEFKKDAEYYIDSLNNLVKTINRLI